MVIDISVKNKIAKAAEDYKIVCGNSDYTIKFAFDSEWDGYEVKTARFGFKQNGVKKHIDVLFENDLCNMPVLNNIGMVEIGVFAGDLHTTTPCLLSCEKSILCESGTPEAPTPDIYNQIIEKCNEAVEIANSVERRADNGEFDGDKGDKGDKGDAGAIKLIVVAELPETGDESAIYLLPVESAQEQNTYKEYIYTNGAWEQIGSASVSVNLDEYVKKTDYATANKYGVVSQYEGAYGGINLINGKLCLTGTFGGDLAQVFFDNPKNYGVALLSKDVYKWIKVALAKNPDEWTAEEKTAARELIGAVGGSDYATGSKAGVVKLNYGLRKITDDGKIGGIALTAAQYKSESVYSIISKGTLENIKNTYVKEGLTTNTETLTDEEKASACAWLGVDNLISELADKIAILEETIKTLQNGQSE